MMHLDQVTLNLDGSLTITLSEFMNPTVAATFAGAVVTPTIAVSGPQVNFTFNVVPGAPIASQTIQSDPGGSAVVDG